MSAARVLGFNHTSFTVADLDMVIPFFRDALGFALVSRGPRDGAVMSRMTGIQGVDVTIAHLRGPGHTIELIQYARPVDRDLVIPRMCDTGASHIALDVDDVAALVEAAAEHRMLAIGEIVTIDAGPNRGARVVYLQNADGLTVELIQKPGARAG